MIVDGVVYRAVSIEMLLKNSSTFVWKVERASFHMVMLLMVDVFLLLSSSFLVFLFFSKVLNGRQKSMHRAVWSLCAPSNFLFMFFVWQSWFFWMKM